MDIRGKSTGDREILTTSQVALFGASALQQFREDSNFESHSRAAALCVGVAATHRLTADPVGGSVAVAVQTDAAVTTAAIAADFAAAVHLVVVAAVFVAGAAVIDGLDPSPSCGCEK